MTKNEYISNNYTTELITDEIGFKSVKNAWDDLVLSNSYAVTLCHDWLFNWWNIFKDDRDLFLIIVYQNQKIVGIAPLLRRNISEYGIFNTKRLEFLGSGEDESDEICSDYLDFIIDSNNRSTIVNLICDFLNSHQSQWDEIILTDIYKDSENLVLFREKFQHPSFYGQELKLEVCPYVTLPDSYEELCKTTKINKKETLNRKKRLFEKEGEVKCCEYRGESITKEVFYSFIELHQQRWNSDDKPGSFSSNKFSAFHENILSIFKQDNRVVLYFIYVDNKPVCARYCFDFNGCIYDYLPGLDPNFNRKLSPGLIGLAYSLECSIKSGHNKFDFFKGKSGGYKYRWTDKDIEIVQYRIQKNNRKSQVIRLTESTIQLLRQLKRRLSNS
jgi:hypothetical protein